MTRGNDICCSLIVKLSVQQLNNAAHCAKQSSSCLHKSEHAYSYIILCKLFQCMYMVSVTFVFLF